MCLTTSKSGQVMDDPLKTLDSLKVDYDNITRELACAPSRPPLARAEIYPVFEAMDNLGGALSGNHKERTWTGEFRQTARVGGIKQVLHYTRNVSKQRTLGTNGWQPV